MLNKYLTSLATSKFNVFNTSQLSALKPSLLKTSSISTLSLLLGLVYGSHLMAMDPSDDDEGNKASPTRGPSITELPPHVLIDTLLFNDLTPADRVAASITCKELYWLINCFEHTQNPSTIAAITANSAHYFPTEMEGYERARIIKALAPLSVDRINAIAANSAHYFTAEMNGYNRGAIIAALAPLSGDQITARGQAITANSAHYFTAEMNGYNRAQIIAAVAPLSVDRINAIAANPALVNQLKTHGFLGFLLIL